MSTDLRALIEALRAAYQRGVQPDHRRAPRRMYVDGIALIDVALAAERRRQAWAACQRADYTETEMATYSMAVADEDAALARLHEHLSGEAPAPADAGEGR